MVARLRRAADAASPRGLEQEVPGAELEQDWSRKSLEQDWSRKSLEQDWSRKCLDSAADRLNPRSVRSLR
jgi:hypothetical protein